MAKVSFDGINKLIIVNTNVNNLDVGVDIYSEWKRWSIISTNLKFLPAFSVIGGETISETRKLGTTYFFINGWKMRPYEGNHTLQVNGNLYTDDGSVPIVDTLGAFNVNVISTVSAIVDREVIVSSGGGISDINNYANSCECIFVDANSTSVGTTYPTGTKSYPVNNLNDAITICEDNGLCHIAFLSDITINKTFKNYILNGMGNTLTFHNSTLLNTTIQNCTINGNILGNGIFEYCNISEFTIESADFRNCNMIGNISILGNYIYLNDSYSSYEFPINLSIDSTNLTYCKIDEFIGAINIKNSTMNNTFNIHFSSGLLNIDSTCTSGIFNVSGICNLINNSIIPITSDYILTPKNISKTFINYDMNDIDDTGTGLGTYLKTKLLTIFRFIGLK